MTRRVGIAAVQMASGDWHCEVNRARADRLIRAAAAQGADVVVCPELFTLPYFCIDENGAHFALAQPFEHHPDLEHYAALARELGVVLPVGFFERDGQAYYNSIAVIDADGRILGRYRKTHIPGNPGYSEKFYFTPGDTGFRVWNTACCRLGIGICWDQWFPETARALALLGAEVLCFPSIIGSEPSDPDWDSAPHWQRVMQGHAAANLMPLVAANRIGREIGRGTPGAGAPFSITFYGSSFIADESGARVAEAGRSDETVLVHTFDLDAIESRRRAWGLFRDRRPSQYQCLMTSDGHTSAA